MSSPDSKEINLVRCIKCGKILKCSRYDTAALLEHIRIDHPEVDIVDTDTKQRRNGGTELVRTPHKETINSIHPNDDGDEPHTDQECDGGVCRPRNIQHVKDIDSVASELIEKYPEITECEYSPHNPNAQVVYTRRYKVSTPSPISSSVLKQPFQRTLYRTSVEKWCPAKGTIYCPKCGCNKRPLIKLRAERLTTHECGACCLLSCWPFCFIPWIIPGYNNEYLYCANCKTFLGMYNSNSNCIKPNRMYTSTPTDDEPLQSDTINKVSNNNASTDRISGGGTTTSKQLSSIIVNGKQLPPEAVARIRHLKRYSSFIGIHLDDLEDSPKSTNRDHSVKVTPTCAAVN